MNINHNQILKLKITNSQICPIQQIWPSLKNLEKYKDYRKFLETVINFENLPNLRLKVSEICKSETITQNFLNLGNLVHEKDFKISTDSEQTIAKLIKDIK